MYLQEIKEKVMYRKILPNKLLLAGLLMFVPPGFAGPVIYTMTGDISVDTVSSGNIDGADLDGASFVVEMVIDSDAVPVSTWSDATSARAIYRSA